MAESFTSIIFIIMGLAIYFIPTMVAYKRKRKVELVFLINVFFGRTVVGWIVAFTIGIWEDKKVA